MRAPGARGALRAGAQQLDDVGGRAERVGDRAPAADRDRGHDVVVDLGDQHVAGRARGAVEPGQAREGALVLRRGAAEDEAGAVRRGGGGPRPAGRPGGGGGRVEVGELRGGDVGIERLHGVAPSVGMRHDSILGYAALSHIGRMERVRAPRALLAYDDPLAASHSS